MGEKKGRLSAAGRYVKALGTDIKDIGTTFVKGDWKTKASFLVMGFGELMRGQVVRGIALLGSEILLLWYIISFGAGYLKDFTTLGTKGRGFNPDGTVSYGDNSFLILLYSLLTIIAIAALIFLWRINLRDNIRSQQLLEKGKKLPSNRRDLHSLLDEHFDKTLLALPVAGIFVFTVLPIIFMICIAFTNYDYDHQPPSRLFTWVGLENFRNIFSFGSAGSLSSALSPLYSARQPSTSGVEPLDLNRCSPTWVTIRADSYS